MYDGLQSPGRNDECWCGSGKKYKKCHLDFDERLEELAETGEEVPPRDLLKTPAEIEGIKRSAEVNIGVLDYVAERIAPEPEIPATKFIEATGLSFNTIPPSDHRFFELINENVQSQPATSYDVELAGELAAIGIVHGQPFNPDERMKKILAEAAAVGQATGRARTTTVEVAGC